MGGNKLSFDSHFEQQQTSSYLTHLNAPKKRKILVIALSFPRKPCKLPPGPQKICCSPGSWIARCVPCTWTNTITSRRRRYTLHFQESEIHFRVKKPSGHQDLTFTSIEQRNLFIDGFSAHGANLQRRCTFNTRAMSTKESHIARFFQTYGAHVSILDFSDMRLKG